MAIDFDRSALEVSQTTGVVHNLTALSFMAWVYLDADPNLSGIVSINGENAEAQKGLCLNRDGDVRALTVCITHTEADAIAVAPAPAPNAWHHVCGRWSGQAYGGRPEVFVDGVNVTTGVQSPLGEPTEDGGGISVGVLPVVVSYYLDGGLADVAIFSRRVSDREIASVARGRLRSYGLGPVWCVTLEGSRGAATVGDVGLMDLSGGGNPVDSVGGAPTYRRDPPLHWADEPRAVHYGGRASRNSRSTLNVTAGVVLRSQRAVGRRAGS